MKDQVISDWKVTPRMTKGGSRLRAALQRADAWSGCRRRRRQTFRTDRHRPVQPPVDRDGPGSTNDLSAEFAARFRRRTGRGRPAAPDHVARLGRTPRLLADLYADRIVAVIELHEAKPVWDPQDKSRLTMAIMAKLRQELSLPLDEQLCTVQAVSDRLNYQPATESKSAQ